MSAAEEAPRGVTGLEKVFFPEKAFGQDLWDSLDPPPGGPVCRCHQDPKLSRRGWAKATLFPSQGVPWFIPLPGHGNRPAHPCTGPRLPSPFPRGWAAFGEGLGPHRHHLNPMDRGRTSGKGTLAMITGSPLHVGEGLLSFLAPTPRGSASVPSLWAGSARLGSKNSWVPGRGGAGSLRLVSFMLILLQRPRFSPQDQPWDPGNSLPEAFCFCRTDPCRLLFRASY